ncbi:MAG TPA: putative nucleotide-diphospho-sugar transferase, partial [Marmoricola sp.]|nr:putative nucleotide-diphospho-sugar transferase [Marmoricola sp.]
MSRSSRSLHVSFIVDRGDQFPFQADVLLNSLQRNTPITIDSVVAQFVEGAHPGYRAELDDRGVRTTTVTRFLDGIWSNKLQQLQHFVGRGVDVMLVDTDVFFASDPTPQIPDRDVLSGKPVAIMGAGGGMGTSRSQYHLRQVCVCLNLQPLNKPEV